MGEASSGSAVISAFVAIMIWDSPAYADTLLRSVIGVARTGDWGGQKNPVAVHGTALDCDRWLGDPMSFENS